MIMLMKEGIDNWI